MKVSVVEALRIQKEIAHAVQTAMRAEHGCRYGVTKEDGVVLDKETAKTFPEVLDDLKKLFVVSQSINTILSDFSVKNGVSSRVRERENLKVLQRVYETALASLSPATITRFEVIGNEKKKVLRTFEPFISKKELMERIKGIKARIRAIQAEIDTANAQVIELPFEYDDIEMLNETEQE